MLRSWQLIALCGATTMTGAGAPAWAQSPQSTSCAVPPIAEPDQPTPLQVAARKYARTQFTEALTRPALIASMREGIARSMMAGAPDRRPPQELITLVQDRSEGVVVRCMPTIMSIVQQHIADFAAAHYDVAALDAINGFFGTATGTSVLNALNSLPETAQMSDLFAALPPADGDAYRRFLASPAGQQLSANDPLLRQAGEQAADRAVVAVQPAVQAEAVAAVRQWMAEHPR